MQEINLKKQVAITGVIVFCFIFVLSSPNVPVIHTRNVEHSTSIPMASTGSGVIMYENAQGSSFGIANSAFDYLWGNFSDSWVVSDDTSLTLPEIMGYSGIILPDITTAYTASEIHWLEYYLKQGGKIFAIGEAQSWMGAGMADLLQYFGFEFDDYASDSNDRNIDHEGLFHLGADNILSHFLTSGVEHLFYGYGNYYTQVPENTVSLISLDNDDTVPLPGAPLATYTPIGDGALVTILDITIFCNIDFNISGTMQYPIMYGETALFLQNLEDWLTIPLDPTNKEIIVDFGHGGPYNFDNSNFDYLWGNLSDSCYFSFESELTTELLIPFSGIILPNPTVLYTEEEMTTLILAMKSGKKIFAIGEAEANTGAGMADFLYNLGFQYDDFATDSDDNNGVYSSYFLLDENNFAPHILLAGVQNLSYIYGNYYTQLPAHTTALIKQDTDGTAVGNGSALATYTTFGKGALTTILDITLFTEYGYFINGSNQEPYKWGDNRQLIDNIEAWLASPIIYTQKPLLYDLVHITTLNNLTDFELDITPYADFNEYAVLSAELLEGYYGLILFNPETEFTLKEIASIQSFMARGGKVFLSGDWYSSPGLFMGLGTEQILTAFGFGFGSALNDFDDNDFGNTLQVILDAGNFLSHSVFTNVVRLCYFAGNYYTNIPQDTTILIKSDNDANSSPPDAPLMTSTAIGRGYLLTLLDTGIFDSDLDTSNTTSRKYIEAESNHQFVRNIIAWLRTNPHTLTQLQVLSPNGEEILMGEVGIYWNAALDSFDYSIRYTVSYSNDSGSSWEILATDLTTPMYLWNTTAVANGETYLIKVQAVAGELSIQDQSDAVFTISNIPPEPPSPHGVLFDNVWIDYGIFAAAGLLIGSVLFGLVFRKRKK